MPAVLEDRMMAMEAAHAELIRQLSSSRRSLQQAQLQLAAMQQAWSMVSGLPIHVAVLDCQSWL